MSTKKNIIALIACGGKSERMGLDKCSIDYHGQPQYQHLHAMLSPICSKVLISCNAAQSTFISNHYVTIVDAKKYEDSGPIAALLSFHEQFPLDDVLLIGCDYPLLTAGDVSAFISVLNQTAIATAFYNESAKLYEPLLAYYTQPAIAELRAMFDSGNLSLQSFLNKVKAAKFLPSNTASIQSVDHLDSSMAVKALLQQRGN